MKKTLLRSKLHRINVTQVELDYEGSCAVDVEILAKGNMQEYDIIIICSYGLFDEKEASKHEPVLVYFDDKNNVKSIKNAIPEQKL